jgi:hypothetical protein
MEENLNIIQADNGTANPDTLQQDSIDDYSNIQTEDIQDAENLMISDTMRVQFNRAATEISEPENPMPVEERIIRKRVTITANNYKYIGETLNNKKDGLGICYYTNGDTYIGQWRENNKEGWGQFKKSNGILLQGELKNNAFNGYCEKISKNETFIGLTLNGFFVEQVMKKINNKTYEMTIGDSLYKEIYNENLYYVGQDKFGIYYNDGKTVAGNIINKKLNGYGEVYYKDGSKFFGYFINGRREGFGIILSKDSKTYSMGYFIDELKNGPFFISTANSFKLELYHLGFRTKTIDKYDVCNKYLKVNYPEYYHLFKINYSRIMDIFKLENM